MSSILTASSNRHKEFKKIQNNGNPSQCVIICDLVSRKNKKLGIRQISWKSVLRNELSWFMTFRPNNECYDDIHGIVCLNMSILYTSMHIRIENNVAEENFHFCYIKNSFLIFRVPKMGCFVKQLPKICYKFKPQQFLNILDHM